MKLSNTLVIATALVSTIIACSRQGEGERCITANGDADCESGLVCTPKDELYDFQQPYAADRCCPPIDGPNSTDSRCERRSSRGTTTGATGGSSNSTTAVETAGSAGTSEASGGAPAEAGNSGA